MDLSSSHNPEASSSSSSVPHRLSTPASSLASAEAKPTRSSARVKAAKQQRQKELLNINNRNTEISLLESSSSSALPRTESTSRITKPAPKAKKSIASSTAKGKGKAVPDDEPRQTRQTRRTINTPLTINEPLKDSKGKKRAAPDTPSDDDIATSSSKRPRTNYSLRSNNLKSTDMPRKPRVTNNKGKMAMKSKMAAASSSRIEDPDVDEDVEMLDSISKAEASDVEESMDVQAEDNTGGGEPTSDGGHDEGSDDDDGEEGDHNTSNPGPIPGGLDESAAMAIFGDYRQFGSYMMSLSSRLKTMLSNIKLSADPTTRLVTLQELSELLSISTEDTLAGSFPVEQFVRELVKILGGSGADEDEDDDGDEDRPSVDDDAALAAALSMSTGGTFAGDENLEAQVLACRCLANLMEALPGVAHTVVYHGAIPVLCSKLIEISYIDLAEQTLSTMEKISEEFPGSIVRESGLAALLNYLDFFSIAVQRTALQAASNCCRNISPDHFSMIHSVWPIIRNCLCYSDQRLVEFACLCVIRVIDSYHRSSTENLETLVDAALIRAINQLLLPAGGSPLVTPNTYTLLLRALATAARASPKTSLTLLEADFVDTLYQILTGVLPSLSSTQEQGNAEGGQGLGGGLADMTVMENLSHRPKDQVEEALSLVSELMPPLPKDGVFDHKAYTEKSLARMVKAKAKADRAAARQAAQAPLVAAMLVAPASTPLVDDAPTPDANMADVSQDTEEPIQIAPTVPDRTELLRSKPEVVNRFMQLMVPILVDVYAASVITPVRVKTLTGLLKAISFLDGDGLKKVLTFVPVASFASSILSSKDHPSLVIGALQLVDLLMTKVPSLYKPAFRREGVFHEVEVLSVRPLVSAKSKDKERETSEVADVSHGIPSSFSMNAIIPGFKKLSSMSLEPDDAITLRARVIQFKYMSGDDDSDSDESFDGLRRLVQSISSPTATEKELIESLWMLAEMFSSLHTSVSSFELLQSGLVDGLLSFATDTDRTVSLNRRQELLLDALVVRRMKNLNGSQTPFVTFVKKLQESLTKMESFDVVTVAQGLDDSKRSSPSLLARQLRLRLVAEDDSGIPRNLHNIVVSIHAIATFQALHDYLRPRVAGLLGNSSGSRLSDMLAALAASGFTGTAGSSELLRQTAGSAAPSDPDILNHGLASASTVTRRRSQRLSAKTAEETSAALVSDENQTSENAPIEPMLESDMQEEFSDEDIDAEVFNDEVGPENSISDKTVTLSVGEDGTNVEAQTPEGTRVATPSARDAQSSSSASRAPARASYAAALKTKPSDWHLEFSMDEHALPLDLTIYGAIHQHEMRKKASPTPPSLLWQGVYTIKFKKISGPASSSDGRSEAGELHRSRSSSPTLSSLPEDAPHAKIIRLLRVLHRLNTLEAERSVFSGEKRFLSESAFVNNKLTAKLTRQLEEPMIVASSCLPDWALDMPQHFAFLFPFATRYNFLQSTSFGYARLIMKWQNQQSRGSEHSRRDEGIGFLGRLQRQKVRISRKHILESAVKVFELYGSSSSILEVEYFEEVGTGLGPTLEFYSLVSKEFARKDLKLWRDSHHADSGVYVNHPTGLYPSPISPEDIASDGGQKRTHILKVIGQFVAKAMLDSRIIDLSLNKIFIKQILGIEVPLTIATLKLVDPELAKSLVNIQNIAAGTNATPADKLSRKLALVEGIQMEDLALDFTIPGYDIELRPGGRNITVTSENVNEYITGVLNAILGNGCILQAKAFRDGFSKVFPITDLEAFSADELVMLFGNGEEDWSIDTLSETVKADHGFNPESKAIKDLLVIMSEYDGPTRRSFLQFITGSPKLPIGGFRGLNPSLTVVRKPYEAPLTADDYLPSVMTCVNYLKLPEYSSRAVMREKLRISIQEGVGSFHLS